MGARLPFQLNDDTRHYHVDRSVLEEEILLQAKRILKKKFRTGHATRSPTHSSDFFVTNLAHLEQEEFCVLFLNNRHRVIRLESMFRGTIDGTSVYPREIVKRALELNAGAVILAHNHPSGTAEPSQADERITKRVKSALELVDIRVLDHILVGGYTTTSLASKGLV